MYKMVRIFKIKWCNFHIYSSNQHFNFEIKGKVHSKPAQLIKGPGIGTRKFIDLIVVFVKYQWPIDWVIYELIINFTNTRRRVDKCLHTHC